MQISDEMVEKACLAYWGEKNMTSMFGRNTREGVMQSMRNALEAALSTDAEPVKTPFEIASKHIPEARVSLLSRAIRQGLNDYGWKNFGTLPEVLMGYIVEAERAEAAAHAEPVKTAPAVAETELKSIDELLMAGQGDDDGSQIMPEFEVGMSVAAKVEACLALLEYRRDVIDGYAADGDWRDAAAQDERWNAGLEFAMLQLCKVLKVDPKSINWDCATETLEGDAQSQIHKVLAASPAYKHGDAE